LSVRERLPECLPLAAQMKRSPRSLRRQIERFPTLPNFHTKTALTAVVKNRSEGKTARPHQTRIRTLNTLPFNGLRPKVTNAILSSKWQRSTIHIASYGLVSQEKLRSWSLQTELV